MSRLLRVACVLLLIPQLALAGLVESVTCVGLGSSLTGTTFCTTGASMATSDAEYGALKVYSSAGVTSNTAGASATASFTDTVTINAPGHAGTWGTATASQFYRYFLDVNAYARYGNASAISLFQFYALGADHAPSNLSQSHYIFVSDEDHGYRMDETHSMSKDNQPVLVGTPLTTSWNFIFGVPFSIGASLQVGVDAQLDGIAIADSSHSAYWAGMTVTAPGLTSFTVSSASGTDWSQSFVPAIASVPEPSSLLLLLSGIVVLCAQTRRRRHLH